MTSPKVFEKMMQEFAAASSAKGITRASQYGRPMDPWNHYDEAFIRQRLKEEIAEWENTIGYATVAEIDELKDIANLAGSLWALLTRYGNSVKPDKPSGKQ